MENREDINFYLRMSGVELCENYFCVCGYYMETYAEEYEDILLGDLGYYQRMDSGAVYISLIELPNFDQNRENRLRSVRENINALKHKDDQIIVIVSRVYDDIIKAHEAYEEVAELMQAMERITVERQGRTIFWEDNQIKKDKDTHLYEDKDLISGNIDAGEQEKLAQILAFINDNYRDCNLSAEAVAEHVGMNKTYLSRLFKHKMKMTYMDYLTGLRMRCAEKLLLETDKTISEICVESGYVDASSFRRKFKQVCGMSVSEYRSKRNMQTDKEQEL